MSGLDWIETGIQLGGVGRFDEYGELSLKHTHTHIHIRLATKWFEEHGECS